MKKEPIYEKELYLEPETKEEREARESENRKVISNPKEVESFLKQLFEEESKQIQQTQQFDENRDLEAYYYNKLIVGAKTVEDIARAKTLIMNRISILERIPELQEAKKNLEISLKYATSKLEKIRSEKEIQASKEPETNQGDNLKIVDDILKEMFPFINDSQLKALKDNLMGKGGYFSLVYVGTKTKMWAQLKRVRKEGGIDRNDIARVFSDTKQMMWKKNNHTTGAKLDSGVIYKKI